MRTPKKRILLVDDTAQDMDRLQQAAEGQGEIVTATCVEDAIKELAGSPFDLVVTDLAFPDEETGGFRVLDAAGFNIPVIVLTRYPNPSRSRKAIEKGAFDFIDRGASGIDTGVILRHRIRQALEFGGVRELLHAG